MAFRTYRKAVRGVLDVAAGVDPARRGQHGSADGEHGVWGVRLLSGGTRRVNQLVDRGFRDRHDAIIPRGPSRGRMGVEVDSFVQRRVGRLGAERGGLDDRGGLDGREEDRGAGREAEPPDLVDGRAEVDDRELGRRTLGLPGDRELRDGERGTTTGRDPPLLGVPAALRRSSPGEVLPRVESRGRRTRSLDDPGVDGPVDGRARLEGEDLRLDVGDRSENGLDEVADRRRLRVGRPVAVDSRDVDRWMLGSERRLSPVGSESSLNVRLGSTEPPLEVEARRLSSLGVVFETRRWASRAGRLESRRRIGVTSVGESSAVR